MLCSQAKVDCPNFSLSETIFAAIVKKDTPKQSATEASWKESLQLPETSFPMRGGLVQSEPKRLARWQEQGLWQKISATRKAENTGIFVLHDGPPFANGEVHMGTALNKILKDFVIKSKTMAGKYAPFVPGWDCHGLPIEYKVMQNARDESAAEIRSRCEEYARGWIDKQKQSFQRLGVFGDWQNPYLTLNPNYEADILRIFGKMVSKDLIYRSSKPVLWSYGAGTALAEAEVEYKEKKSPAIFVAFPLAKASTPTLENQAEPVSFLIWTTTPWTLPANRAIAVHPRLEYVLASFQLRHENPAKDGQKRTFILSAALVDSFAEATGWHLIEEHARLQGNQLAGSKASHPFLEQQVPVLEAEFVTAESGTGQVHIAPGHGADDYLLGKQNNLEVFSPVDDHGCYNSEITTNAPQWLQELEGKLVFDANPEIIRQLAIAGALVGKQNHVHSYPHCWRSKTPVIFRAVPQFFVKIDAIRDQALEEIKQVNWLPHWGENRISSTVENRPDWCISRQRTWGVPLPVFLDEEGEPILDASLVEQVAQLVAEHGSNIWFAKEDSWWNQQLGLPENYQRSKDTLDVWIDSGSSHLAVVDRHPELQAPADLYIEATDQHRGWFQSSLMLSIAWRDKAPYKQVITHGFVIDNSTGEKISKSGEKPIHAEYFYSKFGADIVRLWCASVDYQNEVPFSNELFTQVVDSYRRIRNTFRILLGNLAGFHREQHSIYEVELTPVDRWMLTQLQTLNKEVTSAWAEFDFRKVYHLLNSFCSTQLSNLYIDITKDRLYCDSLTSPRRIASQAVFARVFDDLARLFAPILAYTTDEAWEHAGFQESIHLETFPEVDSKLTFAEDFAQIEAARELRDVASIQLEEARRQGTIGKSLEAELELTLPENHAAAALSDEALEEFLIVSNVTKIQGDTLQVRVKKSPHQQCPRCWRRLPEVGEQQLCNRCLEAISKQEN